MRSQQTTLQMGSIATREVVSPEILSTYLEAYAPHSEHDFQIYTCLSLRNKSYTREAAKVLNIFLSQNLCYPVIEELDLADIIAGRPEAEALDVLSNICAGLEAVHQRVKILNLSDNALGEKGLRACFPLLLEQSELSEIYFCNNGMSARASEVIADEILLFRGPNQATNLTKFQFYNNMSGDGGALALSRVIRQSPALTHLRFSATRAGRPGSLSIAQSCANLKNLTHLDLSDNTFGFEGALALVPALTQNPDLIHLNLRDTALGDAGANLILKNIQKLSFLSSLDLSGNELTSEFCHTLVSTGLPPQLRILALEENEFGSTGAKILSKFTPWPTTLEELKLNSNEFTTGGGLALVHALLTGCPSLKVLGLDGNSFSTFGMTQMQATCQKANRSSLWIDLEDNMEEEEEEEDDLIQQFERSVHL